MTEDSSLRQGSQRAFEDQTGAPDARPGDGPAARGPTHQALPVVRPAPTRSALMEPATQIVTDRSAYLGQGRFDIGQRLAQDHVELFVTGDPGMALQRQFEQHDCQFIAVHDVCTSASLRLVKGLADNAGLALQRLTVRRQGDGAALLQLQFAELTLADGSLLRLYSTDVSAEPAQQRTVARALLGFASLSVLIVADGAPALLTNDLRPLREAIASGPWPNPHMLVIPLGDNAALTPLVTELPGPSPLAVHITPQTRQTAHMWTYLSNTWNRVGPQPLAGTKTQAMAATVAATPARPAAKAHASGSAPASAPVSATAPAPASRPARGSDTTTIPGPLEVAIARASAVGAQGTTQGAATVPIKARAHKAAGPAADLSAAKAAHATAARNNPGSVPGNSRSSGQAHGVGGTSSLRAMPSPGATPWAAYIRRCGHIKGVVAACVFDAHTGGVMAATGGAVPSPERLALQGMALLTQAGHAARALGVQAANPEIAISSGQHHLLVRPVPGHPGVALHLMLSADSGSLTLARMHLERLESPN